MMECSNYFNHLSPQYITEARGNNRLPGIMTLGYIAAFSETLALAVVVSKGKGEEFFFNTLLLYNSLHCFYIFFLTPITITFFFTFSSVQHPITPILHILSPTPFFHIHSSKKGIAPLKDALINEPEDHLKAAAAWSLGQIGRHSPDHARALAEADVLRRLLAV